jgi:hypothetical protein
VHIQDRRSNPLQDLSTVVADRKLPGGRAAGVASRRKPRPGWPRLEWYALLTS